MTCKVSVNDVCAFDAWNAFWLAHGHESTDQVICSGNKFATVAASDRWIDRAHVNLLSSSRFVDMLSEKQSWMARQEAKTACHPGDRKLTALARTPINKVITFAAKLYILFLSFHERVPPTAALISLSPRPPRPALDHFVRPL